MDNARSLPAQPRTPRVTVDARLVASIAAVWFFWGSTLAGMRVAVATMPPFVMTSIRFTVAGLLLYAVCAVRGRGRIARGDIVRAVVTGASLLLFGNGVTAYTVQYLPTGINSLLLSLAPVYMAIIAFVWGGERPTRLAVAGMALGLVGLAVLLSPQARTTIALGPALLAEGATIAWAFGSIYARRTSRGTDLLLATALQMLAGGVLLGIEAALFGQWRTFDPHAVSAASIGGLAWLVVFGSLVGYSAYLYTMQAGSTALASTYAYVNPIVSIAIGSVLFGERLDAREACAAAIIVGGVALMLWPARAVPAAPSAPAR